MNIYAVLGSVFAALPAYSALIEFTFTGLTSPNNDAPPAFLAHGVDPVTSGHFQGNHIATADVVASQGNPSPSFSSGGWTTPSTMLSFVIQPTAPDATLHLTSLTLDARYTTGVSGHGPDACEVRLVTSQWNLLVGTATLPGPSEFHPLTITFPANEPAFQSVPGLATIELRGLGATSATYRWWVDNVVLNGNTVTPVPEPATCIAGAVLTGLLSLGTAIRRQSTSRTVAL